MASLVSLPLAMLLMVGAVVPDILSADHVNPGVGVAAVPALNVWFASFLVTLAAILFLAVARVLDRRDK